MKKIIVSLFMSVVLIFGVSAMTQSTASASKTKAKTEVKSEATKPAACKDNAAKCPMTKKTAVGSKTKSAK